LADHQRSTPDFAGWDRLDAMLSINNLKPYLYESAKRKDLLYIIASSLTLLRIQKKSATFLKLSNCWQYILA
jgi:hypothetical protein